MTTEEFSIRLLKNPGGRGKETCIGCNRNLGTAESRHTIKREGGKEHVAHEGCLKEALAVLKR